MILTRGSIRLPDIDWSVDREDEPTSKKPLKTARRLDNDVSTLLGRGESLAQALRQKIDSKISARFYEPNRVLRHAIANRQKNAQRYGYKIKEYRDGHEVKVHRNGCVRLYVSAAKPALKFWTPKHVFAACEESGIPAVIEFSREGLFLVLGSSVIFERSRWHLSQMKNFGNEWIKQIEKELACKRSDTRAEVGSEKIAFKKRSISAEKSEDR
jgi:hypothetical protein